MVEVTSSMHFKIRVPMHIQFGNRILTVRFQYAKTGSCVIVYYKWKHEAEFSENALIPCHVGELSERFGQVQN